MLLLLFLIELACFAVVHAQQQAFVNEPFEVQLTGYSTISCVSSLQARANMSMFAVDGVPKHSFSSISSLNITFLYSGTMNLTVNGAIHQVVVIPRSISIGSVFPYLSETSFEMMAYVSVKHVNTYLTDLLPNTTLVLDVIRSSEDCSSTSGLQEVWEFVNSPEPPVAIFGSGFCLVTLTTSSILSGSKEIPLLAISSPEDLNLLDFPYLVSIDPFSFPRMSNIFLDLINRMGYKRIIVVEQDNSVLENSFFDATGNAGIEVKDRILVPSGKSNYSDILQTIRDSDVRVVLCSMYDSADDTTEGFWMWEQAYQQNMLGTNSGYIWITVALSGYLQNYQDLNGLFTVFVGETYMFPEERQNISAIWNNILTVWTPETDYYYQNVHRLSIEDPSNPDSSLIKYYYGTCEVVNGVLMLAKVLHQFIYVEQVEYTGEMLKDALREVDFNGPCGGIYFDADGQFHNRLYAAYTVYVNQTNNPVSFPAIDINEGAPYIPMSINLSNTVISQWVPDFVCPGTCGQGVCLGPNDCQCLQGYQEAIGSSICTENYGSYDDSISIELSPTLFLMTRAYERFIANTVASSLNMSLSQIKTVEYSSNGTTVLYQFIVYKDIALSNVVLEGDLANTLNELKLTTLSPLAAYMNLVLKDWIRASEPIGIVLYIITACLGIAFLVSLFLLTKSSSSLRRNTNAPHLMLNDSIFYFGILFAFTSCLVHVGQPTDFTCRLRPWVIFLSLAMIGNVKIAKLYRLHRVFNNQHYEKIQLTDKHLFLFYTLPATLLTIVLLILADVGKTGALLESQSFMSRERAWVCVNESPIYGLSLILLVALHLCLSSIGAVFRYSVRHVPVAFLHDWYVEVVFFVAVPFTCSFIWLEALTDSAWTPRLSSIIASLWIQSYALIAIFSEIYNQVKNKNGTIQSLTTANSKNIKPSSTLKYIWSELNQIPIKCLAQLFDEKWESYEIKVLSIRNQIALCFYTNTKDCTSVVFSISNISGVVEINDKNKLVRIVTKDQKRFMVQLENQTSFDLLLQILTDVIQSVTQSDNSIKKLESDPNSIKAVKSKSTGV